MPFLSKKKSASSALSMSSSESQKKSFAKFDEKKDYDQRCTKKHLSVKRGTPCLVSFCVGKKF